MPVSELKLFSGSAHPELAKNIASYLGVGLSKATVTQFPDGETFVKINENIRGRDIFMIQPTCPPTNENIMELLIMTDAARRASAERITAVIPFFGYARQDRKDQPRVPITAKLIANLLVAAGVNRVLTMDLHAGQIQGFFDIPVDHLYAAPVLIKHIKSLGIGDNLVVVSPDVGGMKMAYAYSQELKCPFAIVAKHRVSATEVEALEVIGDVKDKDVMLVDDITETAGTLKQAAEILKAKGAQRIFAGVSHALLEEMGQRRIAESPIERLFTTDSTPLAKGEKVDVITVAELMGEGIRRIHHNESVTNLFDIT
ncbi:MAG: ribose-phosphate pyrophosphokinase [Verrucomicrobiales bacterium]|nr:ribose-phosphate pyrophosphokinase [Verrucomicrobiales bacterium]